MTLEEFANKNDFVVLFWCSTGYPTGDSTAMGYPDFDFPHRRGLLELTGRLDGIGRWLWDGIGKASDDKGNSITQLTAASDRGEWESIVKAYESEVL